MYHSRLHVTNGLVSAALDALTGEPLELVLEENRENILKSNLRQEASPLKVCLRNGRELRPPKYAEIRRDGTLRPSIECCQPHQDAVRNAPPNFLEVAGISVYLYPGRSLWCQE